MAELILITYFSVYLILGLSPLAEINHILSLILQAICERLENRRDECRRHQRQGLTVRWTQGDVQKDVVNNENYFVSYSNSLICVIVGSVGSFCSARVLGKQVGIDHWMILFLPIGRASRLVRNRVHRRKLDRRQDEVVDAVATTHCARFYSNPLLHFET